MIGKILGNRYRVLREVGSGGMAWVYLAEDINEGRLVAIKILYPQFGEDLAYIQRFNREAKLASTLSDQHIVRVLDYGATRDVHYLVMEYIEGQDLRGIIDERGNLPWREALRILDQLGVALEHAHLHGVVHRDIKPQNLMITAGGVLKVLDFGIARARMLPSLTQSGFVGSPYYISPEQAMGEGVDIRSDVYSAGIVLFEMLSGRVPYNAASPWSIISQHIASEPPHIDLRGNEIPESTETLLHRMIAKRPEDRFQTPTVLREAIACVLEGHPLPETLSTQPPAVPDRLTTSEALFQRARQAMEEEDWQRAVDLLNQVVKLDPEHPEASAQLAHAGRQARLAALYVAASRAMEAGRWQEAIDELGEIISVEPNFHDAQELLERARAAQENVDVAESVSSLYEEGVSHINAGLWEEAAHSLRRVQQLSPGYKQTQTLLAEAESHLRSGPGLLSGHRRRLVLVAALLALLILTGAYYFIQNKRPVIAPELATRVSEDAVGVYREAQAAFQDEDWDRAIELLDAILASEPKNQDARALREQAEANRASEQSFRAGEAAYSAGRLNEAISVLSGLRQIDVSFRATEVQDMLCDAYLQRGRGRIADWTEDADLSSIESALEDFEAGLAVCPDNGALSTQQDYANRFLRTSEAQALEDWNTVIRELTPVVAAEPDYANGGASHMLYVALVKRGEIRQQAGDLASALSDFEQALTLDKKDPLGAASLREEVSGGTLPRTPQPDETLTFKYAAPALISPENETLFRGKFTPILLEWGSVGSLAYGEYYDVTIMHFVGEEPRYWGGAVKETQWQVPVEAGFGEAGNDRFHWWVTVRRANTASGPDQLDLALSPSSDTRIFYWGD